MVSVRREHVRKELFEGEDLPLDALVKVVAAPEEALEGLASVSLRAGKDEIVRAVYSEAVRRDLPMRSPKCPKSAPPIGRVKKATAFTE